MSPDKLIIALMSGFADGVALPRLAVLLLILAGFFICQESRGALYRCVTGFFLGDFFAGLLLRISEFSPSGAFNRPFQAALIFYSVLGVTLFVFGAHLALLWYSASRNSPGARSLFKFRFIEKLNPASPLRFPIGLFFGIISGYCFFSWPLNMAMVGLSNDIFLPGLLWPTVWSMVVYEVSVFFFSVASFCAVLYLTRARFIGGYQKHRSLLLTIGAAVYMAVGIGLTGIFIQQLF